MEQQKMDRINELSRIARERELTEQEQTERQALRQEYIDAMKGSLRATLDSTVVVDGQGNQTRLKPKSE